MEVHVIVPEGIDDPARPSGGNTYDRRVCAGLAALGWVVHEHGLAALGRIPDGAAVLLDGLIASPAPEVLVPHARRLRQVVLMHMPLGDARERAVLEAATAVVTTSEWTRRRLLELYALPAERIHVAEPGVDAAEVAPGSAAGGELLCVAAVTPGKGHDVLVDALAMTADLPWRCTCVGSLVRDPAFAAGVRRRSERVQFVGTLTGPALDRAYAAADLLVLPSHAETYGMVVTEALARGIPVLATDVGGIREALGRRDAGLLVPPGDPAALAAALRAWLTDAQLRTRLRRAARERRASLRPWAATTSDIAGVLEGVAASARVSAEWLELREPADAAARSAELAERLRRHLPAGRLVIHDLGGGSGAMGRWLAPRLPGPQHWVVHDRDADLLELAVADAPGVSVEARVSDITRLSPDDLAGASLVTASALLDLLTADELVRMLRACAGRPLLLALTVVGRVALRPADPLDGPVGAAFNAHQRRAGRLGPDAVAAAIHELRGTGAEVVVRPSPWRLNGTHGDLTAEWLRGWVGAACEQEPALAADAYRERRLAQAAAGELAVTVDHADLLVLP